MDEKLAALKTQFPMQFELEKGSQIDVHQLPKGDDRGAAEEPSNLAEALRQRYEKSTE